jgi:alpha-tubulin suppressor-like RCC1 family protein
MTVPVCDLISCVNAAIPGTTCSLNLLQLASVARDFSTSFVISVPCVDALPDAACNKGRWIYVLDACSYRFSDGVTWTNDFTSVLQDFQVWSWGSNIEGQLGTNNTTARCSPVSLLGSLSDWCYIGAGAFHGVALNTSGEAWSWGNNRCGQLGDCSVTNSSSPVSVVGVSDWSQINAGRYHNLALRSTGSAWSWGINQYQGGSQYFGNLGDGTYEDRSSPVSVVGGFLGWRQLSAGGCHSMGISSNRTLWSWGNNSEGELGVGDDLNRFSPVSVMGGFSDWCQVSAGWNNTLAIRAEGCLWAWGSNTFGGLGDGTTTVRSSPVSVTGGFSDWCQVATGGSHSIALRTAGTAWSWGYNNQGQLGDFTTTNKSSPVSVVGGISDWCAVSAGLRHNVALRSNGEVWSWGANNQGQLGTNTFAATGRSSPMSVSGGFSDWYQVSAGECHTMALNATQGFA